MRLTPRTKCGPDLGFYFKCSDDSKLTTRRLGMLALYKGILSYPDSDCVRLGITLNIPKSDFRRGIAIIKESLAELPDYELIETGSLMKGTIPDM